MRRKTPRQKKELSYRKDRRNAYGENDKSSRKSIRQNERVLHRSDRRREYQTLTEAHGAAIADETEAAELKLAATRPRQSPQQWRKWPDQPLGDHIESRLRRRVQQGIDKAVGAEDRLQRIHRRRDGGYDSG